MVAIYLACISRTVGVPVLFDGNLPWWSYVVGLQNFWMAADQSYGASWLAGTWSLAIEEQFYLLFPLLVYLVPPAVLPRLLIAILVFCPIARTISHGLGDNLGFHVLMPMRADILAIGALIAWVEISGAVSAHVRRLARVALWASVCFFPVFAFLLGRDPIFHMAFWGYSYLVVLFGAIVFSVLQAQGSRWLAFLRTGAAAFFARISYALYLVHTNILVLTLLAFGSPRTIETPKGAAVTALAFAISVLICAASFRFFEAPLVKLAHHRFTFWALASPIPKAPGGYIPTAIGAFAIFATVMVQDRVSHDDIGTILRQSLQPIINRGDVLLTELPTDRWPPAMRDSMAFCLASDTPCIRDVFNDPARGRIFVLIRPGVFEYPSMSTLLTSDKLMAASGRVELYGPFQAVDVRSIEANAVLRQSQTMMNKGDVVLTELAAIRWSSEVRGSIVSCGPSDASCIKNVFNASAPGRIFVLIQRGVLEYPSLSGLLSPDKLMTAPGGFELYGPFQAADVQSIEANAILRQSLQPIMNRGDVLLTELPSVRWPPAIRDSIALCGPSDTSCIRDVFNDPARGHIFVLIQPGALEYPSLSSLLTADKLMDASGGFELYGPLQAADVHSIDANAILRQSLPPMHGGDVVLTELPSIRWSPEMREAIVSCAPSDTSCIKGVFPGPARGRIFVLIQRGVLAYPPLSVLLTADKLMIASDGFELYGPLHAADVQSVEANEILRQSLQPILNRGDVLLTELPSVRWPPLMRDSMAFCAPSDALCIKDVFNDPARGRIFVLIKRGVLEYPSMAPLLTPEKRMAASGGFELYGPLYAADVAFLR
jgi:peptidoglycan/LPS O-acetylase OafA/YrhL